MNSKPDLFHLHECANPTCESKSSGSKAGIVLLVRIPRALACPSIRCPLCGVEMRHDGWIEATESGHLPGRVP